MHDVFICCTSTDVKIAERLSEYLEYYNVGCFVANRDIPAGVPWAYGIAEAIKSSKMMIALFSEDFNSGTWMDDELKTANIAGVPILTFRLSDTPFGETKAMFLKNTACVAADGDAEGKFPILYEEVCNFLGLPVEQPLPVDEVLSVKQPEVSDTQMPDGISDEKVAEPSDVKKSSKGASQSLFPAVLIGLLLTLAVVMFLEWIFA